MMQCHQWLGCTDLPSISIQDLIGSGAVKSVYRAIWNGTTVAAAFLNNGKYLSDFKHNLNMLKIFNQSRFVVQLVGFCENENIVLTEYHKFGNALNLQRILRTRYMPNHANFGLKLCLNYAMILDHLHNGPAGTRVMCDSNDLNKLLSQLLVTQDLQLILNDLDALPLVDYRLNLTIKCGLQELRGDFVAPEQRWQFEGNFEVDKMAGYGEKTDIWKAASVCEYFLSLVAGEDVLLYRLFDLHKSCKYFLPELRPSAKQLVQIYKEVAEELEHTEL
uniref:Protein O-mannose kinase n=1 Tax=Timema tahoe TaxID=61484 RepID=A0A7R9FF92_9NEOP|nr:unnamed protein product [Timema tahoe]